MRLGKKLLTLQKCLVRIINDAPRLSHADPLFYSQRCLKIDDLYIQSVRMFSFKLFKNVLPTEISSLFPKVSHNYSTRSAKNNFYIERSDQRSMKYIAPRCWNLLPLEMKQASSIASFKTMSKNSLLEPYDRFVCKQPHCPSCPVIPRHNPT